MKLSQKELCCIAVTAQIRIGKDTSDEAYNRKVEELQSQYHMFVECTTGRLMRMGLSYEEAFKTMIIVLKYGNAVNDETFQFADRNLFVSLLELREQS